MNAWNRLPLLVAGALLASVTLVTHAHAQWPDKPIRFVVPYPPGGIGDSTARAIGQRLSQRLGQPVIIDNRPGGAQIPAADTVAKAAPDGYTILLGSITNLAINSVTFRKLPYDPQRDFAPISLLFQAPLFLVTNASVPAQDVKSLVALAKTQPGKLAFGSIGTGSSVHLAGELLNSLAKVDTLHVPYKGSAPAMTDLLGGQIQMMFDGGTSSLPHVKSGKLRLLAVTSAKRSPYLPEVPTMEEAGVPGYVFTSWWGLVAPAATPQPIIDRLNAEWKQIAMMPDIRAQFSKDGIEFVSTTPEQFSSFRRSETERLGKLVKSANIVLD